jgi:prepilin-type N-terminal cleavage/methylation domain-containing protein
MLRGTYLRWGGFTLIELLVVVAIIALLIAILLPSLSQARDASKLAVCGSNLHQLGAGIQLYSNDFGGIIPRGPDPNNPFDFSGNQIATNQLWIGSGGAGPPVANPHQFQGLGPMIHSTCPDPKVYFCPADSNYNLDEELPRIETDQDAYGSYLYRQLDALPLDAAAGLLDNLGENIVDDVHVCVEALALDTNSLGPDAYYHVNHGVLRVNVLFRDGSVRRYANRENCLAIPPSAFDPPTGILTALDQIMINADFAFESAHPSEAPRLPTSP